MKASADSRSSMKSSRKSNSGMAELNKIKNVKQDKKKLNTEQTGSQKSSQSGDQEDPNFWLQAVPSEDFRLNSPSLINPFKFIEEIEQTKRDLIYKKNVKQSTENRKLYQEMQRVTKKVLINKVAQDAGPDWFQDLSFEQMDLVNDLQRRMLSDLERKSIDEVQEFFHKLGIIPYVDGTEVWRALKQSEGDPIRFLFSIQKVISAREQEEFEKEYSYLEEHNMPRASFSVNERLILSAVFHYHFPLFTEQLKKLLPAKPEKSYVLWGKKKPKPKMTYESPYLEPMPINEMCWYEEKAERDLEKKVLKKMKEHGSPIVKKDRFSKYSIPLIEAGKVLAEAYVANISLSEKKKRKKRRQEVLKKSKESVMSKDSWEINCELESMMDSEEKFFEKYSISDKELLEGGVTVKESKISLHSKKVSVAPPNLMFTMMFAKQTPKKLSIGSVVHSEEEILETLRPILATHSEIEIYNDMSNDPTRISGTIVTSQIVEGRLVETRSHASQTVYTPEYGILRRINKNLSYDYPPKRTPSVRTLITNVEMESGFITHGYFDYMHPCPEQIYLKGLLKEIRYDMDYLLKISALQQEDSLIPTVNVDSLPISHQESLESSLLEVVGYEENPSQLMAKSVSIQSKGTNTGASTTEDSINNHLEECPLDKRPFNVECQDEECGIIDDPDTEIPMDEYTLARRKIAALPPEKQLKAAVDYLKDRGDALGVLPAIEQVPWLIRWYEIYRGIMVDLTAEDKDQLMEDSIRVWDTPYFKVTHIPIPEIPMKKVVTWDRIKEVKEKAAQLNLKYQRKVRQQMVTNARNAFQSMKVEYFKSPLNQSFRRTYFDYEPSKEADCLTIKPWKASEKHNKEDGPEFKQCGSCKRQRLLQV
ncbi:uncharacterized protein LOC106665921 [Cimex lectularius]|uniref:DUF4770 domain-containing protein n=1 Tax=Cimex lectularius TaxID=79782 RepID=A0A8I6RML5_CIMLE|nr:uncharacterized protein LOC106665921 [Cimex lectularius]